MDLKERLLELGMQGFECSQIMMMIALEIEEKEKSGSDPCGERTDRRHGPWRRNMRCADRGCCVLGLFTGKGDPEEMEDNRCHEIIQEYTDWFREQYLPQYGGTDCVQIIGGLLKVSDGVCTDP